MQRAILILAQLHAVCDRPLYNLLMDLTRPPAMQPKNFSFSNCATRSLSSVGSRRRTTMPISKWIV